MENFNEQYRAGLRGEAYSGSNPIDREMHRAGRAQRYDLSGGAGDAAGLGLGALIAGYGVLVVLVILAPLAAVLAVPGAPILARLRRRRGEDWRLGTLFLPVLGCAFIVSGLFIASWLAVSDGRGVAQELLGAGMVAAVGGALAGGLLLRWLLAMKYPSAVIDVLLAVIAPAGAMLLFFVIASSIATPQVGVPLVVYLFWIAMAGAVIAVQAALVFGLIARVIGRRPFLGTTVVALIAAFVAMLTTACIWYYFPLGGTFLGQLTGRGGPSLSGVLGGPVGYVVLNLPGLVLCHVALGMVKPALAPWSRGLGALVMGGTVILMFLNATRAMH